MFVRVSLREDLASRLSRLFAPAKKNLSKWSPFLPSHGEDLQFPKSKMEKTHVNHERKYLERNDWVDTGHVKKDRLIEFHNVQ